MKSFSIVSLKYQILCLVLNLERIYDYVCDIVSSPKGFLARAPHIRVYFCNFLFDELFSIYDRPQKRFSIAAVLLLAIFERFEKRACVIV